MFQWQPQQLQEKQEGHHHHHHHQQQQLQQLQHEAFSLWRPKTSYAAVGLSAERRQTQKCKSAALGRSWVVDSAAIKWKAPSPRTSRSSFDSFQLLCILGSGYHPQLPRYYYRPEFDPENSQTKKQRSQSPPQNLKKKAGGDPGDNGHTPHNSTSTTTRNGTVTTHGSSRVSLPSNMEPTYYIGGGNGNAILEEVMNGFGWKRIKDKTDEGFKLRWCESKTAINYTAFKEGEQLVNHIPNCNLLTNKLGLLNSLQEYSRVCANVQKKAMKLDFIPETYRLDDPKDKELFMDTYKENEIWICKPTGRNQGKGIFLVRSLDELNRATKDSDEANLENQQQGKPQKPLNRIIQRYITNPLLIDGRKFDIRCYMLIASTVPYIVLYHKGYLRLSMYEYDNDCDNIIAHLTNQFIQKKDPRYCEMKEETAWSMDKFNDYVNEKVADEKGIEQDWVYNTLPNTMKQIMTHCFNAVKHRLQRKIGYFDLYGLDFMIDEDMKVWLIEMNINPCLATNCSALKEIVPGVVRETLNIAVECFEKARRGRTLLPINNLKEFEMIYSDNNSKSGGGNGGGQRTTSPVRSATTVQNNRNQQVDSKSPVRGRSLSPVKEPTNSNKTKKQPDSTVTTSKSMIVEGEQQRPKKASKAQKSEVSSQEQSESRENSVTGENSVAGEEETEQSETIGKETKKENGVIKPGEDEQGNPDGIKQKKVSKGASAVEKTNGSPVNATKEQKGEPRIVAKSASQAQSTVTSSTGRLKLTHGGQAAKRRQTREGTQVEEKPNRGS